MNVEPVRNLSLCSVFGKLLSLVDKMQYKTAVSRIVPRRKLPALYTIDPLKQLKIYQP